MKIDDKVIGNHIKVARKNAKLTQSTCAILLNVSNSYYSRIECGTVHLNLDRLFEICKMLNTRPEFILEHCCPELDNAKYEKIEDTTAEEFHRMIDTAPADKLEMMFSVCKALYKPDDNQ